ncbi:MAG: YfhO family protein, partial [Candidatus Omnitrophota bacterium]
IIPLILFFIAVLFRKDSYSSFFKGVFIVGLILIFGRFTPLYKLFYKFIPGFGLIRYPVKFFFLLAVSFAFLSGAGWQEYTERIKQQDKKFIKTIKLLFILGFISTVVFLLLYLFKTQFYNLAIKHLKNLEDTNIFYNLKYISVFSVDFFNLRRMLVFFIIGSLFLFSGARQFFPVNKYSPHFAKGGKGGILNLSVIGSILLVFIFIDLYGGKNIEVNPLISRSMLNKNTPHIDFLKKDKSLFRIYTSFEMNKLNEALRGNTYEEAFANSIDNLCANRLIEYGIYDARGYFSIHNSDYSKLLNVPDTSPMPSSTNILNMLNVKYILTPKEIQDPRCKLVNKTSESFLYENMDVLPRAYIVPEYIVLNKELDIYNKLKSKEFNPGKEVVISGVVGDVSLRGPQSNEAGANSCLPVSLRGPRRNVGGRSNLEEELRLLRPLGARNDTKESEYLNILQYKPNEVIIEVNIKDKPKFVVLADNYYPGWQVFIEGRKGKIYKANFVLRGVYLLPGKHTIRFVYDSLIFKLGVLISLVTVIIIAVCVLYNVIYGSRKL